MNVRTTLWLLFFTLALAVLVWLGDRNGGRSERGREERKRVLPAKAEEVTGFRLEREGLRLECVRSGDEWRLTYPIQGRADAARMEQILGVITELPCRELVTPEQRATRDLSLADYGLAKPQVKIQVTDRLAALDLWVGLDAPLGNLVYTRLAGSEDVMATPRDFLALLPQDAEALRDRTLLHGDPAGAARLEIRRAGAGFVQLARQEGQWMIQQPFAARADAGRVGELMAALYGLRAEHFVWDPPAAGAASPAAAAGGDRESESRLATYGLTADAAALSVRVWGENDQTGRELLIGRAAGETNNLVYARVSDSPSVYAVTNAILAALDVNGKSLRDRYLFPFEPAGVACLSIDERGRKVVLRRVAEGWLFDEPALWRADRTVVEETVRRIVRLTASGYLEGAEAQAATAALEKPAFTLQVLSAAQPAEAPASAPAVAAAAVPAAPTEKPAPAPWRLRVAAPEAGRETVYAAFEGADVVAVVPVAEIRALGEHPGDPLLYHDRTVLAVSPERVRRLAVVRGGGEQSVERGPQDAWVVPGSNGLQVAEGAVDDVLLRLAGLRALRVESYDPARLASFGLEQPAATLRIGLTAGEGIQKSLHFGFKARTDGVYSMIQGQDVVFVLSTGVVSVLTRDLVQPAPAAGAPSAGPGPGAAAEAGAASSKAR